MRVSAVECKRRLVEMMGIFSVTASIDWIYSWNCFCNIGFPTCHIRLDSADRKPHMEESKDPNTDSSSVLDMPETPRVLPFALFLLIGAIPTGWFPGGEFWLYLIKTVAAGWLLWAWRRRIIEMRWAISWEAVVVGLVIAVLWIGLEGRIPSVGAIWDMAAEFIAGKERPEPKEVVPWNPLAFYQDNLALAWFFIAVRVLGRSLVVPAMEEVFYRSFVYRYIGNPQFMDVPIGVWHSVAFVVTAFFFGLAHPGQWLAAILCAMAYQALVIRKKRLGDAMTAHAITNLVISVYAIGTGQWHFT